VAHEFWEEKDFDFNPSISLLKVYYGVTLSAHCIEKFNGVE